MSPPTGSSVQVTRDGGSPATSGDHWAHGDQTGIRQHPQMLHHPEAGDRLVALQPGQGLAVPLAQAIGQATADRISQGTKDIVAAELQIARGPGRPSSLE